MRFLNYALLFCFVMATSLHAEVTMSFPGLSADHLSGAKEYGEAYSVYAKALSTHYGRATGFTNHLSYPIGADAMGGFPSFYAGLGLGTAFSNTRAIRNETSGVVDPGVVPAMLPTLGLSLNFGVGISKKWDIRIGFMPLVTMALPFDLGDLNATLKYGNAKLRVGYNFIESSFLKPGVSLAAYVTYTEGALTLKTGDLGSASQSYTYFDGTTNHAATTSFDYSLEAETKWRYLGMGVEVRAWYDLMFFMPYIGYGLGLQGGSFSTSIGINGDITVSIPSIDGGTPQVDTGFLKTAEQSRADSLLSRIILGFEVNLILAKIVAEVQFDTNNRLAGLAVGSAFSF